MTLTSEKNADWDAGSRMHVLDWLESDGFLPSLRKMVAPTGFTIADDAPRQPRGRKDTRESVLTGSDDPFLSSKQISKLKDWWLVHQNGAKLPTWDLVMSARSASNEPALILVEAKAHASELSEAGKKLPKRKTPEQQARSDANHEQIAAAIQEASNELNKILSGVSLSEKKSYQLANRIAFSWKLASMGIPVALIYLGFTGDSEIAPPGEYFETDGDWQQAFREHLEPHFSVSSIEKEIGDGQAGFWILPRSLRVTRLSPSKDERRRLT